MSVVHVPDVRGPHISLFTLSAVNAMQFSGRRFFSRTPFRFFSSSFLGARSRITLFLMLASPSDTSCPGISAGVNFSERRENKVCGASAAVLMSAAVLVWPLAAETGDFPQFLYSVSGTELRSSMGSLAEFPVAALGMALVTYTDNFVFFFGCSADPSGINTKSVIKLSIRRFVVTIS